MSSRDLGAKLPNSAISQKGPVSFLISGKKSFSTLEKKSCSVAQKFRFREGVRFFSATRQWKLCFRWRVAQKNACNMVFNLHESSPRKSERKVKNEFRTLNKKNRFSAEIFEKVNIFEKEFGAQRQNGPDRSLLRQWQADVFCFPAKLCGINTEAISKFDESLFSRENPKKSSLFLNPDNVNDTKSRPRSEIKKNA